LAFSYSLKLVRFNKKYFLKTTTPHNLKSNAAQFLSLDAKISRQ